jgi:pyruvate kinase
MNWGVIPTLYQNKHTDDAKIAFAIEKAEEQGFVKPGDILVVTAGFNQGTGGTDLIRVLSA